MLLQNTKPIEAVLSELSPDIPRDPTLRFGLLPTVLGPLSWAIWAIASVSAPPTPCSRGPRHCGVATMVHCCRLHWELNPMPTWDTACCCLGPSMQVLVLLPLLSPNVGYNNMQAVWCQRRAQVQPLDLWGWFCSPKRSSCFHRRRRDRHLIPLVDICLATASQHQPAGFHTPPSADCTLAETRLAILAEPVCVDAEASLVLRCRWGSPRW